MKITKTKIALALVGAAWLVNSANSIYQEYDRKARELSAIRQRPALVELYDKRTQLYDQQTPYLIKLGEIDRMQRNAKENHFERVASLDCIVQGKNELEQKASTLQTQINQADKEINKIYSDDQELSNLQKEYKENLRRGMFPLSLIIKY